LADLAGGQGRPPSPVTPDDEPTTAWAWIVPVVAGGLGILTAAVVIRARRRPQIEGFRRQPDT
jgi:hypothetical protein